MMADPGKFHAIFVTKKTRNDTSSFKINIGDKLITSEPWVKLLGIKIDNNLNFVFMHIKNICKAASGQLNALCKGIGILFPAFRVV